ncbi:DUF397 domain-containing protein [Streptomyces sp. NPDC006365]|uniref:DUF397 domain-containing protein n=1 Tax=Streptomyces sp. NPDC006365 TaxID=3364744 RepID=UPI0036A114DF
MCCFLDRLVGHFDRKVHLVVDGHSAHRSRQVRTWLPGWPITATASSCALGHACVEVAKNGPLIAVRDSKRPELPWTTVRRGVGSLVRWPTGDCAEPLARRNATAEITRPGGQLAIRHRVGTSRACPPCFCKPRAPTGSSSRPSGRRPGSHRRPSGPAARC